LILRGFLFVWSGIGMDTTKEFEYYYIQAIAKMDVIDEITDTFLIRKGDSVVLQYFPNRKEVIVTPDFGVIGDPFFLALEQCDVFNSGDTAYKVEDFH
jgi:hypothetical protein